MMHHEQTLPANRFAQSGFALALLAFSLAIYGALLAPWHLRSPEPPLAPPLARAAGFYAPLVLGLTALILGTIGLRRIEQRQAQLGGDMHGVFAIMIGGLAAVVGAVQIFADLWPNLRG